MRRWFLLVAALVAGCRFFDGGGGDAGAPPDAGAHDGGCTGLACDGSAVLATMGAADEIVRSIVLDGGWVYFASSQPDPGGRAYFAGSVWRVPLDGGAPPEELARDDHSPLGLALADGRLFWGHAWDLEISSVAVDGSGWTGVPSGAPSGTIGVRARGRALYLLTSTASACTAIVRHPLDRVGFEGTLVECGAGPFAVDDTTLYAFVNGRLAAVPVEGPGIRGDSLSGSTFPRQVDVADGVLYFDAQDRDRPTRWQIHRVGGAGGVVHDTYDVARMAADPQGLFVCRPTLSFIALDAPSAVSLSTGACAAIAVDADYVVASDGRAIVRLDRASLGVP